MMRSCFSLPSRIPLILISLLLAGSAAAQEVSYRYFRWTPLDFRDFDRLIANNGGTHISEFEFLSGTTRIAGATVTQNEEGDTPNPTETPDKVYDNNLSTKYFDFARQPLLFEFPAAITVDGYRIATANAANFRDPTRWSLEGSNVGLSGPWDLIDERVNDADLIDVPTTPTTFTEKVSFNSSIKSTFTVTGPDGFETSSSINISAGQSVTFSWTVTNASATLNGNAVLNSDSQTFTPSSRQTFTLTGMSGGLSLDREITIFVDEPNQDLVINEFVADASLDGILSDEDGDPSDWIEIFNPNPFARNVSGFKLTTSPSGTPAWTIPADTTIPQNGYLIIFASGKAASATELRADFTLDASGGYIALLKPGSTNIEDSIVNYPPQQTDVSYGRQTVGSSALNFFLEPTPGATNDTPAGPAGPAVQILTPPGTFTNAISVALATSSGAAPIRFTLDGTVPTASSFLYFGPQVVSSSTIIRARTFQPGFAPGPVASQAFVKLDSSAENVESDLPIVLLENFNGGDINGTELSGAFFSLFEADETTGKATLDSIPTRTSRVSIGRKFDTSSGDAKQSFRLEFLQDGSDEERDVNLFGLSSHDEWLLYAPFSFDTSLVRAPFIHSLSNDVGYLSPKIQLVQVYFNREGDVKVDSNPSSSSNDFYGVYALMERPALDRNRVDVEVAEQNDLDVGEIEGGYLMRIDRVQPGDFTFQSDQGWPSTVAGDSSNPSFYNIAEPASEDIRPAQRTYVQNYIEQLEDALDPNEAGFTPTGYREFLDVDSAINRSIFAILALDPDSLRFNTYLVKPRGEKLRFGPIWDMDRGLSASNENRSILLDRWLPEPARADFFEYDHWDTMFNDDSFAQAWIDRWHELRDGEFSNERLQARVDTFADQVSSSQQANFSRWSQRIPENNDSLDDRDNASQDYSGGDNTWAGEVTHLKGWLAARADWIDSRLNDRPLLTAGGRVTSGTNATVTPTEGVTYYTTNGSDPRLADGTTNPAATMVTTATNIPINDNVTILARSKGASNAGKFNSEWSGLRKSTFITSGTAADSTNIVVSEIMYDPEIDSDGSFSTQEYEYLEFQNTSNATVSLAGVVVLHALRFEFPLDTSIPANGAVLLVRNQAAFEERYGTGRPVIGEWQDGGELNNGGERILVNGIDGTAIADFYYQDAVTEGWPLAPAGMGSSLTLDTPAMPGDFNDPSAWRASISENGSPGDGYDDFCEEWKSTFFNAAEMNDDMVSGDDADPDLDGIGNLLELGLGLDPRTADPLPFIEAELQELTVDDVTGNYFTITFTRRRGVSGLDVVPGFSNTLQIPWSRNAVLMSARDLGNGNEEVVYRDSQAVPALGSKRFGRIEVRKN